MNIPTIRPVPGETLTLDLDSEYMDPRVRYEFLGKWYKPWTWNKYGHVLNCKGFSKVVISGVGGGGGSGYTPGGGGYQPREKFHCTGEWIVTEAMVYERKIKELEAEIIQLKQQPNGARQ